MSTEGAAQNGRSVFVSFSAESIAKIGNAYFAENTNIGIRDQG
jgi:hypothetical protein